MAISDGKWHHVAAVMEDDRLRLYVDGALAREAPLPPMQGREQPGGPAIGRLVEGGIGCQGLLDELRLRRGTHPPDGAPVVALAVDESVVGLWSFEAGLETGRRPSFRPPRPPLRPENHVLRTHPINCDRIYDFYAKQLLHALELEP